MLLAGPSLRRLECFAENRRLFAAESTPTQQPAAEFVLIEDGQVIQDALQHTQVFHVPDNAEAETLFVLYVTDAKALIHEGDLFRKYRHGPLRRRRSGSVALEKFIAESGLEIEILVGNRGVPATLDDLRRTNLRKSLR